MNEDCAQCRSVVMWNTRFNKSTLSRRSLCRSLSDGRVGRFAPGPSFAPKIMTCCYIVQPRGKRCKIVLMKHNGKFWRWCESQIGAYSSLNGRLGFWIWKVFHFTFNSCHQSHVVVFLALLRSNDESHCTINMWLVEFLDDSAWGKIRKWRGNVWILQYIDISCLSYSPITVLKLALASRPLWICNSQPCQ